MQRSVNRIEKLKFRFWNSPSYNWRNGFPTSLYTNKWCKQHQGASIDGIKRSTKLSRCTTVGVSEGRTNLKLVTRLNVKSIDSHATFLRFLCMCVASLRET